MFAFLDSPVEIGIIVLVVLLLFGGSQLPKLAKNLGQAQKEFKDGISRRPEGRGRQGRADGRPPSTTDDARSRRPVAPAATVTDAQRAEELRQLEARMAELKAEQPRSDRALT